MEKIKSFLIYVGVSCLIGLCFATSLLMRNKALDPHWFVFMLISAGAFAGLMLWLYPVFAASRRSLRHAGLAIVIWSFLAGMATALMSVRC